MIISEFDRNNPVLKDRLSDLLRLTWPEEYGEQLGRRSRRNDESRTDRGSSG